MNPDSVFLLGKVVFGFEGRLLSTATKEEKIIDLFTHSLPRDEA